MRTLTGMGGTGSARELAEMLRQMGRGPDTMLAHITPEEAQMLLESGGSGRINPMTGLPEFQPEDDYLAQLRASEAPGYYGTSQTGFNEAIEAAEQIPFEQMTPRQQYDMPQVLGDQLMGGFEYTGGQDLQRFPRDFGPQYTPGGEFMGVTRLPMETPAESLRLQEYAQGLRTPQEVQPGILDRLTTGIGEGLQAAETGYREFSGKYPMLSRLLTTGASSLPAILAARSARQEGRAAAEELRRLGQPLREQGEALRQQALTGGLTPQQARQQEARRAQMLQSASTRGATSGTQQAMIENTLARERAGIAETNLNNAIRQLNLANAYDEAAIRAKLQTDTQSAQILASIMGDLVRTAAGQPRGRGGQPQPQMQSIMPEQPVTPRPQVT
jgi:hypothetical protein